MARRFTRNMNKPPVRWLPGGATLYGAGFGALAAGLNVNTLIANVASTGSIPVPQKLKVHAIKGDIWLLNTDAALANQITMGIIAQRNEDVAADPRALDDSGLGWMWMKDWFAVVAQNAIANATHFEVNVKPKRWLLPDFDLRFITNVTDASNLIAVHLRILVSE